ncbi:hypothetical protein DSECCO2_422980 [anaerobic digester metagenome]|jgi:hypothetical protein
MLLWIGVALKLDWQLIILISDKIYNIIREVWKCLRKQNGTIAQDVKKKRFGIIMRLEVGLVIGNVGIVGKKKLFESITVQIGNNHTMIS